MSIETEILMTEENSFLTNNSSQCNILTQQLNLSQTILSENKNDNKTSSLLSSPTSSSILMSSFASAVSSPVESPKHDNNFDNGVMQIDDKCILSLNNGIINNHNDNDNNNNDDNENKINNMNLIDDIKLDTLIFLINTRSGGRKGFILGKELEKYNHITYDIHELAKNLSIKQKLAKDLYCHQNHVTVVICSGDGSVAWATSLIDECIETLSTEMKIVFPTICTLPIGTGNDLSRSLGWGNVEVSPENVVDAIADIHFAKFSKRSASLDRWDIKYTFTNSHRASNNENNIDDFLKSHHPPLPKSFLCYLSFGYDARVAYDFEQGRSQYPNFYNSQMKNQIMYVRHGFFEFFYFSTPLNNKLHIEIDNEPLTLPEARSFKLLNINSAMNGAFFWGTRKSRKTELQKWELPRLDDSKIEVVSERSVHDMMQQRVNLTHAHRLSQARDIKIQILQVPVALQIDGEAWIINEKITLHITLRDKLPTMIGYHEPRGVDLSLQQVLTDANVQKARLFFRERMRAKYYPLGNNTNKSGLFTSSFLSQPSNTNNNNNNNNGTASTSSLEAFFSGWNDLQNFNVRNILKNNNNNTLNNNDQIDVNHNNSKKNEEQISFSPKTQTPTSKNVDPNFTQSTPKNEPKLLIDRFSFWKTIKDKYQNNSDIVNNNNNNNNKQAIVNNA